MKLYKYLISALLLGSSIGFSSCNKEEDDIFDGSAAQRLDEYKKQYSNDLTDKGGKWLMEYFANEEERGYAFVLTFNKDGSVKVSGQNVWIDNSYMSDVSMWQIIADDGPVLSFNTFNKVFHVFSDPENLVGPEAPINPDTSKDVDEKGEGHGGDYEFVIIGLSEDGETMHLTGKKRLYDIYMYRLAPEVDEVALLNDYFYASKYIFSSMFPELIITDTNSGEQFAITQGDKGLFDAWPMAGDPVVQTKTMNAIVGMNEIRFRKPFAIERADDGDSIVVEKFVKQADGTYLCTDNGQNLVLDNCGYGNIFVDKKYKWKLNANAVMGGEFATIYGKIAGETVDAYKCSYTGIEWKYVGAPTKRQLIEFKFSRTTAGTAYIYGEQEVTDGGKSVKFNISTVDGNSNGKKRLQNIPSLVEFINKINSTTFTIESDKRMAPSSMKFVDVNNPQNYIVFTL